MSAATGMQAPMAGGAGDGGGGMPPQGGSYAPDARKVGLWVFMAVVTSLFMLFSVAYVMRMATADWQPLRYIPWQLWLSTAVLALASAAWEAARRGAQLGEGAARRAGLVACGLSLAFLAVQLWAWQAMTAMNFTVNGNPASSFFYLLTGLHGLHVCGGLVAAVLAGVSARRGEAAFAANATLCARYWHFLLLLWVGLFALLFLVTPDLVQVVCESVGIRPPQAR
jgi:cytochrome c oxidase subunit III